MVTARTTPDPNPHITPGELPLEIITPLSKPGHRLDLTKIAKASLNGHAHHVHLVETPEDLAAHGPSSSAGIMEGLAHDILYSPRLLPSIIQHHLRELIGHAMGTEDSPDPNEPAILMMPGYFGPNGYLSNLANQLNWPKIWHPAFNSLRLNKKIPANAGLLSDILEKREAPTIAIAHSKGGPTVLKALKTLQDLGLDHLLEALILISPITMGIRDQIAPIARQIPSRTVRSMLQGSPEVSGWEEVSEKNRGKVVTVTALNGDQFTAKEQGFIPGSKMLVVPKSQGHVRQCVDERTVIFQVARDLTNAISAKIDEERQAAS